MIFSEKSIEGILSGSKCMTRRLVKEGEKAEVQSNSFENIFQKIMFDKLCFDEPMDTIINRELTDKEKDKIYHDIHIEKVFNKNGKTKWLVGKDYAVQSGRGKKGLWYCPVCKKIVSPIKTPIGKIIEMKLVNGKRFDTKVELNCCNNMKPLRVVIKSIRKERLLDISEEDAKREGYENKKEFIKSFLKINKMKHKINCESHPIEEEIRFFENPFVWVLEFGVVQ